MKIYLASPFFNQRQLDVIMKMEKILENANFEVYSPRRDGKCVKPADSAEEHKRIFKLNIGKIHWCDYMVACVDDKDTGTSWEMGVAYALKKHVVSFTAVRGRVINLMLAQSCLAFTDDMQSVPKIIEQHLIGRQR